MTNICFQMVLLVRENQLVNKCDSCPLTDHHVSPGLQVQGRCLICGCSYLQPWLRCRLSSGVGPEQRTAFTTLH